MQWYTARYTPDRLFYLASTNILDQTFLIIGTAHCRTSTSIFGFSPSKCYSITLFLVMTIQNGFSQGKIIPIK